MNRTVYVGGVIGQGTPLHAYLSLELALVKMLEFYIFQPKEEREYREVWTCAFLDGEPSILEWTHTLADGRVLYVTAFCVDEEWEKTELDRVQGNL